MSSEKAAILLLGIIVVSLASARDVHDWRVVCELDDKTFEMFKTVVGNMIDDCKVSCQDMLRGEDKDKEVAFMLGVFEYEIKDSLEKSSKKVISWISKQENSGLYDKDQLDELSQEIASAYDGQITSLGRFYTTLVSELASKQPESNLAQTEKEVVALFVEYKKNVIDGLSSLFKDVIKIMSIEFDNIA
ncbi:hypothetical protein HDE_04444 [Halotydeus destructor]|nr:hypothetical protein HDE_04444 [Halotydeus destructor]